MSSHLNVGIPGERESLPNEQRRVDRRYLLVLVLTAVGVLAAGLWLRPKHAPPATVSESEVLRLQMQTQRRELERRALFFAVKARELVSVAEQARTRPNSVPSAPAIAGQRLIVVAPSIRGEPLWVDTAVAGSMTTTCSDAPAEEIVTSSPLPPAFRFGAAFNLDAELVGIVHDCERGTLLLTPDEYAHQQKTLPERHLFKQAGLRVRLEHDPDSGARILELRRNSTYFALGLRPGDLITDVQHVKVTSIHDLLPLTQTAEVEIRVLRGTKELTLRSSAYFTASGVHWLSSRVAEVGEVAAGGAAAKYGLRTGDVVVRVGRHSSPKPGQVEDALTRKEDVPLVVLRDSSELLLERPQ